MTNISDAFREYKDTNSETTANNNLLHSDTGGNMPSTGVLGQPDAPADRPLEKRCYTVDDLQIFLSCSRETVYALLANHEFRWFRLGGSRGPYRISKKASMNGWITLWNRGASA